MLVTISGLPGSGTSTAAHLVAEQLGVERFDGGTVFRALAAERGLDVAAFSAVAEADPSIDLALDERLAARAREGDVVLESRLAAWIVTNEHLPALRVWFDCDEKERAARVAARERRTVDEALALNRDREQSEALRYRTYYGIDITDRSMYDLVLDSTTRSAEDLAAAIMVDCADERDQG